MFFKTVFNEYVNFLKIVHVYYPLMDGYTLHKYNALVDHVLK